MVSLFKKKRSEPIKTALTDEEITHLTTYTKLTREQVQEHFETFIQKNPEGEITKPKFQELTQAAFPSMDSEKLANHIFKMYDADRNGTISFEEFLTVLYIHSSGTPEENLRLVFRMFDKNNDGAISKSEMKKIIKDFYCLLGDSDLEQVKDEKHMANECMKELDTNSDGLISEEEFLASLTKSKIAKILTVKIVECFI